MILSMLIWLTYLVSLYIVVFWLLYYLDNESSIRSDDTGSHPLSGYPLVTVAIPAHNEENTIRAVLRSVLELDYPKDRVEIIVMNDGSTDKTRKIVESVIRRNSRRDIRLINKKREGKGRALNLALRMARGEFFACLDADSFVDRKTLKRMVSVYHNSPDDLAIVTPILKVDKPSNWLQKLQRFEYTTAMFIVRLMGRLDCNYIAPGPFTLYRKEIIIQHGGFDEKNLVEDQEIAYRMQSAHYRIRQCPDAIVRTITPGSLGEFYKQRNRWFKGTLLNIFKYKRLMLNKEYGDFGVFQMPLNLAAYGLAGAAVFFFLYYIIWPLIKWLKELYLVGFDIMPYLRDLHFTINLLDADLGKIAVLYIILLISILTFIFAHLLNKESIKQVNIVYVVPFFFLYFLFLSFVSVIVVIESALGKIQRW